MSDSPYRISDDERDEAVRHLRTALEQGRLSVDEHGQRTREVLQARTNEDLRPVFDDLPPQLWPGPIDRSPTLAAPTPAGATAAQGADAPERRRSCRDEPDKSKSGSDGAGIPGLAVWGGFLFFFWGLPAMLSGGTWSVVIFLWVFAFMVLLPIGSQIVKSRREKGAGA